MGHGVRQPSQAVLLLAPSTLTRVSGLDEVGIKRFYRTVSIGSDPSLPDAIGFVNEAASLQAYAPLHIQGSRNAAGDLTIIWARRIRCGGAWRDLGDAPLNEAGEAYEVDALEGTGAFLRSLTSASPTLTYTAADQIIDLGAPQPFPNAFGEKAARRQRRQVRAPTDGGPQKEPRSEMRSQAVKGRRRPTNTQQRQDLAG
jgi:hypothetical protein